MALVTWADENHDEVFIGPDRYRYVPPTAQTESRGGHLLEEGGPDVKRLTKKDWDAIASALSSALAGGWMDQFGDDYDGPTDADLQEAFDKVSERLH